jgi:RNA polymerase sigma-70 factor, ECF subfamily
MERSEFERLAVAELDAVYRFARFLTRDTVESDELVQDVYARAFRPGSVEAFCSRGGGMRAWLMSIARTMLYGRIEHERAGRRAMEHVAQTAAREHDALEAPNPSGLAGVDWAKASPALHAAVAGLSVDLREVLWLWAVEGMKYREIGEVMGVPIGTVMSRLHRARSQAARAIMRDGTLCIELKHALRHSPKGVQDQGMTKP